MPSCTGRARPPRAEHWAWAGGCRGAGEEDLLKGLLRLDGDAAKTQSRPLCSRTLGAGSAGGPPASAAAPRGTRSPPTPRFMAAGGPGAGQHQRAQGDSKRGQTRHASLSAPTPHPRCHARRTRGRRGQLGDRHFPKRRSRLEKTTELCRHRGPPTAPHHPEGRGGRGAGKELRIFAHLSRGRV